ncbi:MAG TPA: hypothetical protein VJQ78_07455 [Sphingobium sp.]|nr:hypothetical protein [Sphingobium sp.]
MQEKRLPTKPPRTVGRPRRLTVEAIVEAACELGVANLDMGLIAERLNTGVATLYGYVRGREHLLELVAERLARSAQLRDRGQSWQEIIREHAALTYALFQSQPQLITNLMVRESDTESFKYWQDICTMLVSRGLPFDEVMGLYIETNQAVTGAAVCQMRRKTIESRRREDETPPNLPPVLGDYKPTLERIIAGYELEFADKAGAGE